MSTKREHGRREPKQRRAFLTVEAVLDAVARILTREGVAAVTTNRIAEVAGVSIGSVYQYFPDKRAIFIALHTRHVENIARLVETTVALEASAPLETMVRRLIDALVVAHQKDAELHQVLWSEVPHRAEGAREIEARQRGAWRLALASRPNEMKPKRDVDRMAFFLADMVLTLVHSVMARPRAISLALAKEEAVRAVVAFIRAPA
jgi:AcrR family transcriptional regulator